MTLMKQKVDCLPARSGLYFKYIDALRGYAILGVMAVHASSAAPDWEGVGRSIVNQGARGVQLFFVASALTLMMSWQARHDGAIRFYTRRLFRIAPLFWLGMVYFLWCDGFSPRYFAPRGVDGSHVLLTGLFLNGWHPEYITSIVRGGWSIAVEMSFYAVFPALMLVIKGWRSGIAALVVTGILANVILLGLWLVKGALWPGVPDYLIATFLSLWFPSQLPVFLVGFLLYFAIRDYSGVFSLGRLRILLGISLLAMLVLSLVPLPVSRTGNSVYVMYAACFALFAFCLANGAVSELVNRAICYLGKISFSAYLWHFAIISYIEHSPRVSGTIFGLAGEHGILFFIGFFAGLVALTVLFSAVTYRGIEVPFIRLGNRVAGLLPDRRDPAKAVTAPACDPPVS